MIETQLIISLILGAAVIAVVVSKKTAFEKKVIETTPMLETKIIETTPMLETRIIEKRIIEKGGEIIEPIMVPKQPLISAPYVSFKEFVYVLIPSSGVVTFLLYKVKILRTKFIMAKILQSLRTMSLPNVRRYFRSIAREELISEQEIDELDEELKKFDQQPQTPSKSNFFGTPGKNEVYISFEDTEPKTLSFEEEEITLKSPRKLQYSEQVDKLTDELLKSAEVNVPEGEVSYDTIQLASMLLIKDKILNMKRRDMLLKIKKLKKIYEENQELSSKIEKKIKENPSLYDRYALRSSGHELLIYLIAFVEIFSTQVLNSHYYQVIKKNTANFTIYKRKYSINNVISALFNLIFVEQSNINADL